jgi:hypothetical protein
MIVMDGAAIYDIGTNRYLDVQYLPEDAMGRLRERLEKLGVSYFIYTINQNKTRIYHRGKLTIEEKLVLDRLKRSPYREYLEGDAYPPDEAVYYKIIAREQELRQLQYRLHSVTPKGKLRSVIRPQIEQAGIDALYIYAHSATMEQAQKRLMEMLRQDGSTLVPVPVRLRGGYRSERDAIHLLHLVGNAYEPVLLFGRRQEGEIIG